MQVIDDFAYLCRIIVIWVIRSVRKVEEVVGSVVIESHVVAADWVMKWLQM